LGLGGGAGRLGRWPEVELISRLPLSFLRFGSRLLEL